MGLGRWEVYSLLLNANIGAGIMLLPATFQRSGVVASMACLFVVGLLSWFLQVEIVTVSTALSKNEEANGISQPLLGKKERSYQWDLPEIVQIHLGSTHWVIYFLLYYSAITSTLSAYANLISTAIATLISNCSYTDLEVTAECMQNYHYSLIIYFVVVCVLTVLDYKEQAWLQSIMAYSHFVLVIIIFFFAVYKGSFSDITQESAVFSTFPALGTAFSVMLFASVYQMCTPSVMHDSHISHHEHDIVARWVSVSTVGLYALLGFTGLLMPGLPDNISLLFAKETYGYSAETVPVMLQVVNWMVIFIPVLDVWTNSPIYGQSLAGLLTTCAYGTNHTQVRDAHPILYRFLRCFVMIPPAFVASLSPFLVPSTQGPAISFSGNFYIPMIIVYMPLCYNAAREKFSLKWSWRGVQVCNYMLAAFGTVLFFYRIYFQVFTG